MKDVGIAFAIALFSILLFGYVSSILSPWDNAAVETVVEQYDLLTGLEFEELLEEILDLGLIWQIVSVRNLLVWLVLLGLVVISVVVSVHTFIDKFFMKRWFEKADLKVALRRGVLLYIVLVSMIALRLLAGLIWYNVVGVIVLVLSVELFSVNYAREHSDNSADDEGAHRVVRGTSS